MCACKYKVSGSFHSPPGVLFTFPSQYCSLSVTREYLGLEDGPPIFPPGFTCPAVLWIQLAAFGFRVRDCHSLWSAVPCRSANLPQYHYAVRTPQIFLPAVWPAPRSLATTCGISVDFFSSPYLDVSVQAVPHAYLCIQYTLTILQIAGFPHSEIHGSLAACASPWHIAGCRVLHRLLMPRHSPYALCSLTIVFS